MPPQRTHYEILGVESAATPEEIRRQYRRLAKRYHPDVAGAEDATDAHRAFVEITAAYEVLIDRRKREAYDRELALEARRRAQAASSQASGARAESGRGAAHAPPPPRPGPARAPQEAPRPDLGQILFQARVAFAGGHVSAAQAACREVLSRDRSNAEAHALLGDVYRAQGRFEEADRMYRLAVDLSRTARMGPEAVRKPGGMQRYWHARAVAAARSVHPLVFAGWLLVLALFLIPLVSPGSPVASGLGPVSGWTDNLLIGMVGAGLLTGFLVTSTRLVERLDRELRATLWCPGGRPLSLGAVLLAAGLLSFPLVLVAAVSLGTTGRDIPRAVMHVLGISFASLLLFTVAVPAGGQTLLLGGNVIFPCMLLGGLAGGHFRDAW